MVVRSRIAEVGGMCCRADIGGDGRLVDTYNVLPTPFDEVVGDAGADDTALPDNDDIGAFGEI